MLRRTLALDGGLRAAVISLVTWLVLLGVGNREWRLRLGRPNHPA